MNARDSEVISGLLIQAGYRLVEDEADADVVIFNTCSVRQHAEDKVWSAVGSLAKGGKKIIGVVGCMANCYREGIFNRAPNVDFIAGTRDIAKIPQILKDLNKHRGLLEKKRYELDGESRGNEIYHTGFHLDKDHAFVVISEGCENFCSYCVVPYTRGKLTHRNPRDIIKEIEGDIKAGITKITLLGQNVNQWKDNLKTEPINFPQLLRLVNDVKGLKQFSFITSHPKDAGDDLFLAMRDCDKLKKYLHLPLQSASNRILKLMNRGYTKERYLDIITKYREIVLGGELTTDIIVGFPGEAEADFQETFDLVKKVRFDKAYIFKYSARPHAKASRFPDDLPRLEKERRHRMILELQKEISKESKKLKVESQK
ncbi:MAG: tRNA (N6-isopentenyl adenosine(37)-C2)-methylthiotransferase MiaB [Candidatus Omnitrophica bacterium]|nr:tRNA (N6-isopentenyl adenosine(37)-C2)-methylthiotransferase MiaB [Candidatus Omnitrophota bacterium]